MIYQNSSDKFYVEMQESNKGGLLDSLYTFYDFDKPSQVKEVGFYKEGFRNDLWSYNLSTGIKTIKWAHYKDKYLNFETNLFSGVDSAKYGDFFSKLLLTTEMGKIVLSVSVNGPFKDSLPVNNYERITRNEFYMNGITSVNFKTRILPNKPNDIYINEIAAMIPSSNETRYMKAAFSFIDKKHFVELSVSSSSENNIYAKILFDAVLTNFVVDGMVLYKPLKNIE